VAGNALRLIASSETRAGDVAHSNYTICRAGPGGDWYFFAEYDPVAADRLFDLLEEKYQLLADNAHMGQARPDIAKELRYHPV
jgi:hypothetical protein